MIKVLRRKHAEKEEVCLLLLLLQLYRSLLHQVLKVIGVLLQHPEHGVHDVRLPFNEIRNTLGFNVKLHFNFIYISFAKYEKIKIDVMVEFT